MLKSQPNLCTRTFYKRITVLTAWFYLRDVYAWFLACCVTGATLGDVCHRTLPPWFTSSAPSTYQSSQRLVSYPSPTAAWLPPFSYPSPFTPSPSLPCSDNYGYDSAQSHSSVLNLRDRDKQPTLGCQSQFSLLWDHRRRHHANNRSHDITDSTYRLPTATTNQQQVERRLAGTSTSRQPDAQRTSDNTAKNASANPGKSLMNTLA